MAKMNTSNRNSNQLDICRKFRKPEYSKLFQSSRVDVKRIPLVGLVDLKVTTLKPKRRVPTKKIKGRNTLLSGEVKCPKELSVADGKEDDSMPHFAPKETSTPQCHTQHKDNRERHTQHQDNRDGNIQHEEVNLNISNRQPPSKTISRRLFDEKATSYYEINNNNHSTGNRAFMNVRNSNKIPVISGISRKSFVGAGRKCKSIQEEVSELSPLKCCNCHLVSLELESTKKRLQAALKSNSQLRQDVRKMKSKLEWMSWVKVKEQEKC